MTTNSPPLSLLDNLICLELIRYGVAVLYMAFAKGRKFVSTPGYTRRLLEIRCNLPDFLRLLVKSFWCNRFVWGRKRALRALLKAKPRNRNNNQ
ncbi:hypothetical protein RB195_013684 [Necator americanus]|uniref:Bestrophin homolog n=1 Tax=Necator americanus TaxID=51031 RepID=A0ABR1DXC2_NECAM